MDRRPSSVLSGIHPNGLWPLGPTLTDLLAEEEGRRLAKEVEEQNGVVNGNGVVRENGVGKGKGKE